MDSGPKYYYDIQNFIVTNGVDLEQFGVLPPKCPPTGVTSTIGGNRTYADAPARAPLPSTTAASAIPSPQPGYALVLSHSKTPITPSTIFCPECGLRISHHLSRKETWNNEKVYMLYCDQEVVA